jgi:hypothetical protein
MSSKFNQGNYCSSSTLYSAMSIKMLGPDLKIEKCYKNSSVVRSVIFENCCSVPFASLTPFHPQVILYFLSIVLLRNI